MLKSKVRSLHLHAGTFTISPAPTVSFPKADTVTRGYAWESGCLLNFLPLDTFKKIHCILVNHIQLELFFCKVCVGQLGHPPSKSSNCLQLSLQVLAVGSKNYTLLRGLWEVSVLFDIPIHPHLSPSPHGLHSPLFLIFVFTHPTVGQPQFSMQWRVRSAA